MIGILIFVWLACGVIAWHIGEQKGEGGLSFIAGLLLGPIGIVGACFSTGNRVKCPHCYSQIDRKAVVCPQCQRDVPRQVDVPAMVESGTWLFWLVFGTVALGLAAYGVWYSTTY